MTEKTKKDIPRFYQLYLETIIDKLKKELSYNNVNQVPKVTKIVVSMGVGEAIKDNAILQDAANELSAITGQKPLLIKAKRSVSNFKLRGGVQIGCKVTLRGTRMYEFLERLICIGLPRIRDFRGVSAKAFDGKGNYPTGTDEQLICPELNPANEKRTQGMNVAIVTTAVNDDAGIALLREFGMPFTK